MTHTALVSPVRQQGFLSKLFSAAVEFTNEMTGMGDYEDLAKKNNQPQAVAITVSSYNVMQGVLNRAKPMQKDLKRLLSQLRRGVTQLLVAHPILLKMSMGAMMLSCLTTQVKAQDVLRPVLCDASNNPIEGSDGKGVFATGIFKVTLRNISDSAVAAIFDIIWHGNNYASYPRGLPGWWEYVLENFQKNFAPYKLSVDITNEDQHAANVPGRFLFVDSCTNELGGYNVLIIKDSSDISELDILDSVYSVLLGYPSIPNKVDSGVLCCKPRPPLNVDKSILIFTAGAVSGFAGGLLTSVAAGVLINCILNRFKVREKLVGFFKGHQNDTENSTLTTPANYSGYDQL